MKRAGYEIAKFKLKPEVRKDQLLAAVQEMEHNFFPSQEGYMSHTLMELDGGEYLDIVCAETREDAETICHNWRGNEYCEAFLRLIDTETVSIGFGQSVR